MTRIGGLSLLAKGSPRRLADVDEVREGVSGYSDPRKCPAHDSLFRLT